MDEMEKLVKQLNEDRRAADPLFAAVQDAKAEKERKDKEFQDNLLRRVERLERRMEQIRRTQQQQQHGFWRKTCLFIAELIGKMRGGK